MATITAPVARFEDLDLSRQYTYADYLSWLFEERVELLRGWVAKITSPNSVHQLVSTQLQGKLYNFLSGQACYLFSAPFDVCLRRTAGGESVVQPDLCVVCDKHKIDTGGCVGAPDYFVEILSPGNTRKVLRDKFSHYEESGVGEYWIVDPQRRSIEHFVLRDGIFIGLAPRTDEDEDIAATVLPGFRVSGRDIFPT